MKTKSILILSSVILVMMGIIAAGVVYLYSGLDTVDKVSGVKSEPELESEPGSQHEAKLESAAVSDCVAEFSVKNCKSGKQNTLTQDSENVISLISHTGEVLWTLPLENRIVGGVAQIDYYKNNKLQFLFAEGNQLHLIDRLGNEVKSFPVQLPDKAQSGPEKVSAKGKTYWKIAVGKGSVYADLNQTEKTRILTALPK